MKKTDDSSTDDSSRIMKAMGNLKECGVLFYDTGVDTLLVAFDDYFFLGPGRVNHDLFFRFKNSDSEKFFVKGGFPHALTREGKKEIQHLVLSTGETFCVYRKYQDLPAGNNLDETSYVDRISYMSLPIKEYLSDAISGPHHIKPGY